ncbi:MAG: hypothetical protein KBT31_01240 [Firmicutes bacterium]|nr:hypothetical protein [Candidatus Colimorpha enterica]
MKNNKNTKIIIVALLIVSFLVTITSCVVANGKGGETNNDMIEVDDTSDVKQFENDEIIDDTSTHSKYIFCPIDNINCIKELPENVKIPVAIYFLFEEPEPDYFRKIAIEKMGYEYDEELGTAVFGDNPIYQDYHVLKEKLQDEWRLNAEIEYAEKYLKEWELGPVERFTFIFTELTKNEMQELVEIGVVSTISYN